ncbi:TetR/AcrR family transcriptional regulator [Rubrobacter indicoceani]|uniref:TetR/AcrR family transcriptional regulator n=1 Tax=Rubrobacter indicoceani TaxID=2051957 RepID=UPI000E5B9506|nr:TetR/AcrR family transcriptional regulator [Rubrobacter indicoceani]
MTRSGEELHTNFEVESLPPKQEHLIRAAYRVMGEKGMNRLSLQDVADEAGVSKAILPYYFASKENLMLTTMRWVLARVARRIRRVVGEAEGAEAKVGAMLDAIFIDPDSNRNFYLVFFDFIGYAARSDRFGDVGTTFQEVMGGLYAEIIEIGRNEGTFSVTDTREAATVVRAILDGLFTQWLLEENADAEHRRYRETCERATLAYLTA